MRRTVSLILMLVFVFPAAASAQQPNEDGVFVDPDSPTSKEYAVPTEEARRDASGGASGGSSAGGSDGGAEAPLFGVGVDDSKSGEGSGDDSGTDGGSADRGTAGGTDGSSVDAENAGNVGVSSAGGDDGGLSTGLVTGGIALLVLLIGGGIAYALKREDWSFPLGGGAN